MSYSVQVALYTIHPFRLTGVNRTTPLPALNLTVAINTYNARPFPCNVGWCQDVIDAAYLGIVADAAAMVVDRLSVASAGRFPVFWPHHFDYAPEVDHGTTARHALHLMLLQARDVIMLNVTARAIQ
jgi:hypothetical protein